MVSVLEVEIAVQLGADRRELHREELDLPLQGLHIVYDLVEHHGLACNLVAAWDEVL